MKEIYYLIEKQIAEEAERKFPGKQLLTIGECAEVLGISRSAVYHNKKRYPLKRLNTIPELARVAMG